MSWMIKTPCFPSSCITTSCFKNYAPAGLHTEPPQNHSVGRQRKYSQDVRLLPRVRQVEQFSLRAFTLPEKRYPDWVRKRNRKEGSFPKRGTAKVKIILNREAWCVERILKTELTSSNKQKTNNVTNWRHGKVLLLHFSGKNKNLIITILSHSSSLILAISVFLEHTEFCTQ